eukprot:4354910-Amphidinium_carterae.1
MPGESGGAAGGRLELQKPRCKKRLLKGMPYKSNLPSPAKSMGLLFRNKGTWVVETLHSLSNPSPCNMLWGSSIPLRLPNQSIGCMHIRRQLQYCTVLFCCHLSRMMQDKGVNPPIEPPNFN